MFPEMGPEAPALFDGGASCSEGRARPLPLSGGGGPIENPGRFSSSRSSSSSGEQSVESEPVFPEVLTCLYKLRTPCEWGACSGRVHCCCFQRFCHAQYVCHETRHESLQLAKSGRLTRPPFNALPLAATISYGMPHTLSIRTFTNILR